MQKWCLFNERAPVCSTNNSGYVIAASGLIVSHLAIDSINLDLEVRSKTRRSNEDEARTTISVTTTRGGVAFKVFLKGVNPKLGGVRPEQYNDGLCTVAVVIREEYAAFLISIWVYCCFVHELNSIFLTALIWASFTWKTVTYICQSECGESFERT